MRTDDVNAAAQRYGLKVGWTADLKMWTREQSYDELKMTRKSIYFFDQEDIVR
jgi:hypothetical protein